ncbi:MAG: cysteine--tRNA ligase [Candidatus Woesearchaeota archaeon]|jgi:cysteinyl-tRNA synthetase|nr:cysteine--tRNA ligase [Candidatus Woesearchaeota archaeon]MDP7458528.1 cysteine--tRNA ligase [Candidatus Woesearchaeota archaeon]
MTLKIYNTLTRKVETFKPLKKGHVGIYACGPTVYNFVHIGNLRAYIFFDLVNKYLKYKGYKVNLVSNITDIEDKIIRDSQKQGISLKQFTEKYTKAYIEDLKTLNIDLPNQLPKATDYINQMVTLTKKLLEKGYAYKSGKSYYYKIKAFKNYGKIAHLDNLDQLMKNAEGRLSDADEYEKDDVRDFALWKGYDKEDGEVFWETDLGKGRPGWHIECSCMSSDLLGDTFDIHIGGVDLIFPHHTNEIAQSEAASGKKFVNYWLHNEHLLVDGKKMSKSLGNFYTLRDLLDKGYDPKSIRYLLLSTHYRQKLNFTFETLDSAKAPIERLQEFVRNLSHIKSSKDNKKVQPLITKAEKEFEAKLDNDLNISEALAVIFDFIRDINKLEISKSDAKIVISTIFKFNEIIGVLDKPKKETLPATIKKLIDDREQARKNKDFEKADKLRDELKNKGIELDDAPEGVRWKKIT